MPYRPIFGEPIAHAEAKYQASISPRDKVPGQSPDELFGRARRLGGDTLCNPALAVEIALTKGVPIEEAVILAHMLLWR